MFRVTILHYKQQKLMRERKNLLYTMLNVCLIFLQFYIANNSSHVCEFHLFSHKFGRLVVIESVEYHKRKALDGSRKACGLYSNNGEF